MADDVRLNAGSGGDLIAADDVSGVKYQVVKLATGDDGAADMVSNSAPIPVSDAGGSLTVDVGTALPAGSNAIGKLAANTGVDIGDVDVTSVIPGTGATALGKAEDAAHTSGDTGVAALAVRRDTAASGASADGDYATLNVNSSGRLYTSTTVDAALPAGTNAIGKLAANSGVEIGDVDVTTVGTITPGTGASNLGKAEDAAHSSGDVGVMSLAVRRDADTSLVGADGDYAPLQVNSSGSLKVAITAGAGSGGTSIADGATFTRDTTSVTPVGAVVESSAPTLTNGDAAGLSMTTGGAVRVAVASGGVAGVVDDAAVTPGTTEGVMFMAQLDDTSPDSVDEGDGGMLRMSANRSLHVRIRDNAGNERGLNIDTNGALAATVTNATASNLNAQVVGAAASDAAVSGNPVLHGGRASTATPSAMSADGDAVAAWMTRTGATVVDGAIVDDAAFTPGTSRVVPIAFQADESSTDSVDEGDAGAPRMTLDRKVIVTQYAHAAAGGASNYTALSTAAVLAAEIKGSAGKVFSLEVFNVNAAARYVRLYNQTGAPASTDTANVVWQGIIPGATTGGGFTVSWPLGKQFSTGIGIRASTGAAHNDTGALAANELTFNVSYA